eukprot:2155158-Prorocentrum_lima.AAC.1
MLAVRAEVNAAASSQARQARLLRIILDRVDQLELHHWLHLQLILGHDPVGDQPVGRDAEEVKLLRK